MRKKSLKKELTGILSLFMLTIFFNPALSSPLFKDTQKQALAPIKQEMIKLKYVSAEATRRLLQPYFGPETRIGLDSRTNVLSVADTPENLEKILAAIKKIDVKPKDLVFTVQLVIASETEGRTDPELQGDPLIKDLSKLLRFKSYQLLDVTMVRAMDSEISSVNFGPNNQFELALHPQVAEDEPASNIKLSVNLHQVRTEQLEVPLAKIIASGTRPQQGQQSSQELNVPEQEKVLKKTEPLKLIQSVLNLKSGERTVVGVSRLLDESQSEGNYRGLILIISGKIIN